MEISPTSLEGRFTRLEAFHEELREAVRAAIAGPDPIRPVLASNSEGSRFDSWWREALSEMAHGGRVAFAVRRRSDGEIVGSTSFLHIDSANASLEIGSTYLRADARGGACNPDMKLAMLAHAFEAGAVRVELRTDGRNVRSRAAIVKLGAVFEGVHCKQKRLWTGEWRNTAVYAILDDDWPAARAGLEARLDRLAAGAL